MDVDQFDLDIHMLLRTRLHIQFNRVFIFLKIYTVLEFSTQIILIIFIFAYVNTRKSVHLRQKLFVIAIAITHIPNFLIIEIRIAHLGSLLYASLR